MIVQVTLTAGDLCMFPGQGERHLLMVKIVSVGVDAIMTGQTVISIQLDMGLHEISIDLLVAV